MPVAAQAAAVRPDQGEDAEEQKASSPQAKPASARRRKFIMLAAPLLLAIIGAGLWSTGILGHRKVAGASAKSAASAKPLLFAMPELVTNLNGGPNVERYVKVDIRLVVASSEALAAARSHVPELEDMFLTYLRDMRPSELQSPTSTWRLREALLDRCAVVLGSGRVTNILFTNLLVQ